MCVSSPPSQAIECSSYYRCRLQFTHCYAATLSPTKMSSPSKLPAWPLTNMGTAEFTATDNAFVGENTVIGEYIYCEGCNGCKVTYHVMYRSHCFIIYSHECHDKLIPGMCTM